MKPKSQFFYPHESTTVSVFKIPLTDKEPISIKIGAGSEKYKIVNFQIDVKSYILGDERITECEDHAKVWIQHSLDPQTTETVDLWIFQDGQAIPNHWKVIKSFYIEPFGCYHLCSFYETYKRAGV